MASRPTTDSGATRPHQEATPDNVSLLPVRREPARELDDPRMSDVDEWGRSESLRSLARAAYAPIYDKWFRVEWEGLDKIPAEGGALLVANHAAAIPSDAPVIMHGVETELGRRVVSEFGLDLSGLVLDMTNFATYIDSTNEKAPIAQRGKAKQKRADLRLVGLGLVVDLVGHGPHAPVVLGLDRAIRLDRLPDLLCQREARPGGTESRSRRPRSNPGRGARHRRCSRSSRSRRGGCGRRGARGVKAWSSVSIDGRAIAGSSWQRAR